MLEVDAAVDLLLERGVVSVDDIICGDFAIEQLPRRNRNLTVKTATGSGLFVKQPDELTASTRQTLRVEGELYSRTEGAVALASCLPRLVLYDAEAPLLVLELLPAHRTLNEHCRLVEPPSFPIGAWRALGAMLARVHRGLQESAASAAHARPPWVAYAHEPTTELLATLSPARLQALRLVQASDAIVAGLESVRRSWRPETPIHGDIRAANVLVRERAGAIDDIRIVDWELYQLGDAAWDLAGLLDALVLHWLRLLPSDHLEQLEDPLGFSPLPWVVVQAAARALFEGYREAQADAVGADLAPKLALFTAARMLQTALETTSDEPVLEPASVILLQMCENVLADPARAARELFAIV